jgi:hypothetical protein
MLPVNCSASTRCITCIKKLSSLQDQTLNFLCFMGVFLSCLLQSCFTKIECFE